MQPKASAPAVAPLVETKDTLVPPETATAEALAALGIDAAQFAAFNAPAFEFGSIPEVAPPTALA